MQGTTSTATATKVSHGEFELVQQSKRFVPGSLVSIKIGGRNSLKQER
jgi:hypothetical protein